MPKLQLLREQHAAAVKAAETLLALEAPTEEQQAEIETHLALAEKLQKDISTHERAGNVKTFAGRSNGTPPAHAPLPANPEEKPNTGYQLSTPPRGHRTECFASDEDAHYAGLWALGMLFGDPSNKHATKKQRAIREWCLQNQEMVFGHTGFDDMSGGIFVPEQMMATVALLQRKYGVIRGATRVVPTGTDKIWWPRPLKGYTMAAIGEVPASQTESSGTADSVEVAVKDWGGWTRISRDLDEDAAISIADMIARQFAYYASYLEDNTCFNGTGTSAYNGITGLTVAINATDAASSVYTALAGNITFATLDLVDFESMVGQLTDYPGAQNKWYISKPGFYASMARLMDAAGGNTKDDIAGGTGIQFLGYPVVFTSALSTTLTTQVNTFGSVLFGDISLASTFADRRGMTVEPNPYLYMANRQLALFVTQRWGFNVHDITGTDAAGSAICGPVVNLLFPGS